MVETKTKRNYEIGIVESLPFNCDGTIFFFTIKKSINYDHATTPSRIGRNRSIVLVNTQY